MMIITNSNKKILEREIDNNQPLDDFDTSNVTNMRWLFYVASNFNQPLDNFDTSNVTDMSNMFYGATSFNQSLNSFNTSKVTDMHCMFQDAKSFNQPLDNFNTDNVTDMNSMFECAKSFNQPLDNFNTSKVTNMCYMFCNATSMFIGYIMRFAAKAIFVYNKYNAMKITDYQFSNSRKLDQYIIRLNGINLIGNCQEKINSALDGFIVD